MESKLLGLRPRPRIAGSREQQNTAAASPFGTNLLYNPKVIIDANTQAESELQFAHPSRI